MPNSGGLLVLTGPTLAQDGTSYDLYSIRELKPRASIEHLLTIPTGATKVWNQDKMEMERETEKAESVTVLSETTGKATVLVLFDDIDEGRPTRYEVTLPL
jgi:hypothetical protein